MKKKNLFFALLLALQGHSAHAEDMHDSDTLHTTWFFEKTLPADRLASLDPATSSLERYITVLVDLFEPLVKSTTDGIKPGVAQSWKFSADGRLLTFDLDPDAKWSDGTPLTAHDFVFTFERMAHPEVRSSLMGFASKPIVGLADGDERPVGARAVGDHSLQIELTEPYAADLALFSHSNFFPLPKHIGQNHAKPISFSAWEKPVSNGPYKLASINPGAVKLEKNPFHPMASEPGTFASVEHKSDKMAEPTKAYLQGKLDVIARMPKKHSKWLKEEGVNYNESTFSSILMTFIANKKHPALKDIRVRQALSLAAPRVRLADGIYGEGAQPVSGLIPEGFQGFKRDKKMQSENVDAARKLMEQAGYSAQKPLKLAFSARSVPVNRQVYNGLRLNFAKIHLDLSLKSYDSLGSYFDDLYNGRFELGVFGWAPDYYSPRAYLNMCEGEGARPGCGHFESKKFNQLLKQASIESDPGQRNRLFVSAEKTLLEDYTVIPLFHEAIPVFISPRIDATRLNTIRPHSILFRKM